MKYTRFNLKAEIRRKKASIVFISIFVALLFGGGAALLLLERPAVSELENRELEKFPEFSFKSYLEGSFAEQLDRYFTDTVPFRDALSEYAAVIENAKGLPSPQFYGVEIVNDGSDKISETDAESEVPVQSAEISVPDETSVPAATAAADSYTVTAVPPVTEATETASAETSATDAGDEEFVGDIHDFLNNGILVNGVDMYGEKAGIMMFGGNDKQGERYANLINAYKKALGDNVNVYNLIVPTSVEFYLPKKYSKYSNSEKDEIDFIYSKLDERVIPVDAYSVLKEHKDEYIYFRTDHHWSDLGAYYAYTAFCKAIGQTPPALSDYTVKTKDEPYVGSLFGYTNDITLKNNPDTFTYYMTKSDFKGESFYYNTLKSAGANPIYHEYASGSGMYGMFLGSDSMHIKITTSAGTGRKIVMFKESYGNAFAPYLIDSFDEIYVIDIRYFGRNAVDYIKQVGATDVLFINNVFAANTSMLIDGIERMLTSPTGTVVYTAPAETTAATVTTSDTAVHVGITPITAPVTAPVQTTVPALTTGSVQTTVPVQTKTPVQATVPAQTTAPVQTKAAPAQTTVQTTSTTTQTTVEEISADE